MNKVSKYTVAALAYAFLSSANAQADSDSLKIHIFPNRTLPDTCGTSATQLYNDTFRPFINNLKSSYEAEGELLDMREKTLLRNYTRQLYQKLVEDDKLCNAFQDASKTGNLESIELLKARAEEMLNSGDYQPLVDTGLAEPIMNSLSFNK